MDHSLGFKVHNDCTDFWHAAIVSRLLDVLNVLAGKLACSHMACHFAICFDLFLFEDALRHQYQSDLLLSFEISPNIRLDACPVILL